MNNIDDSYNENEDIDCSDIYSMNSMNSMNNVESSNTMNNGESSNTMNNGESSNTMNNGESSNTMNNGESSNNINMNTKKFILPKNKGFMILHEEFIQNDWIMTVNEQNRLVYTKKENNCDEFIILINKKNNINVRIPVANSNIAYTTTFNNYFCACEFITMHIKNYELSFSVTTNN
jgi:hypothetical protein